MVRLRPRLYQPSPSEKRMSLVRRLDRARHYSCSEAMRLLAEIASECGIKLEYHSTTIDKKGEPVAKAEVSFK